MTITRPAGPARSGSAPARARARRAGADGRRPRRYRSIWISDIHLGTRGCNTELLLDFLAKHESEYLYLVGDIVDGWSLRRSWYWNDDHNRVVRSVLEKSSRGTRITYVCGNHDEFLRGYVGVMFGGVSLKNEAVHVTADGKRLLVLHGDEYDVCIRNAKWLAMLGSAAYAACLTANTWLNAIRRRFGYPYWSLSSFLKHKVKNAISYIESFEHAVVGDARRRGLDGVVCGHIHHAQIRDVGGTLYLNDGDWVESCTALVEDFDGNLSIVDWARERAAAAVASA